MAGHTVAIDWNGRVVDAWLPATLTGVARPLAPRAERATEAALAALVAVDASLPAAWESLARILLRAEGIASSSVEGITAPAAEVFAAVEAPSEDLDAGWIADNLRVVTASLVGVDEPITHDLLFGWHRELMRHGRLPAELVGAYRSSPGWIGGTAPTSAAYVAPPHDAVPALMEDLLDYANGDHDDPVTQAAVVHGQFETIHPFGDGNGRLGRILIGRVLARRARLGHLPPPVSVLIARDPGGYISGLYQYREGSLDTWVEWFASIIDRSCRATAETVAALQDVRARWDDATADLRADSAARALLDVLLEAPVLTSALAAERTGVSARAARSALDDLEGRGVVAPAEVATTRTRGRAPTWWAATEVTDLIGRWAG